MKTLTLTFILLLSPIVSADSDEHICSFIFDKWSDLGEQDINTSPCARDHILSIDITYKAKQEHLLLYAEKWCRYDRDIQIIGNRLSCVLNSRESRGSTLQLRLDTYKKEGQL